MSGVCLALLACGAFADEALGASRLSQRTVARAEEASPQRADDRIYLRAGGWRRGEVVSVEPGERVRLRVGEAVEAIPWADIDTHRSAAALAGSEQKALYAPVDNEGAQAAGAPESGASHTPDQGELVSGDEGASDVIASAPRNANHGDLAEAVRGPRLAQLDRELAALSRERDAVTLTTPLTIFVVGAAGASLFSTLGLVLVGVDCNALGTAEDCVRSAPYGYAALGLAGAFSLMSATGLIWTMVRSSQRSDLDNRIRDRRNERSRLGGLAELSLAPLPVAGGAAIGLNARF